MTLTTALLLAALQAPAPTPPPKPFDCSAPEHRQFDFWVGEWDVVPNPATPLPGTPPAGSKPASNVVETAHNGCVVIENWDDRRGGTGQSFNVYDRVRKQWHQTWVDSNGGLHEYWGELKDGNMVFIGSVPLPPASRFQGRRTIRLSFTPIGSNQVRQFSESLNVDGTWSPNYDLIYTRRPRK
ncbi:MAG TPA: DUF1579 family protein [Vicinamibacterales bacterium]